MPLFDLLHGLSDSIRVERTQSLGVMHFPDLKILRVGEPDVLVLILCEFDFHLEDFDFPYLLEVVADLQALSVNERFELITFNKPQISLLVVAIRVVYFPVGSLFV